MEAVALRRNVETQKCILNRFRNQTYFDNLSIMDLFRNFIIQFQIRCQKSKGLYSVCFKVTINGFIVVKFWIKH